MPRRLLAQPSRGPRCGVIGALPLAMSHKRTRASGKQRAERASLRETMRWSHLAAMSCKVEGCRGIVTRHAPPTRRSRRCSGTPSAQRQGGKKDEKTPGGIRVRPVVPADLPNKCRARRPVLKLWIPSTQHSSTARSPASGQRLKNAGLRPIRATQRLLAGDGHGAPTRRHHIREH